MRLELAVFFLRYLWHLKLIGLLLQVVVREIHFVSPLEYSVEASMRDHVSVLAGFVRVNALAELVCFDDGLQC